MNVGTLPSSFDAIREFEVLVNQTKADSCYQLHFGDPGKDNRIFSKPEITPNSFYPASRCLANYDEHKMNGTTTQHFMEECQLPALMEQTIVSVKSDECTFFRNYESVDSEIKVENYLEGNGKCSV